MKLNLDLLKRLSEAPGIPGWEDRVRELVQAQLEGLVDEVRTDAMGNLIAHKQGAGLRVMVAAHLDEIGFYVRYVDERGFLRVHSAGGFDTRNLFARQVTVHAASGDLPGLMNPSGKPIHISTPEERKKVPEMAEFFVDLGLPAEKVRQQVRVGDPVTLKQEAVRLGDFFTGKAMDDRAAVFVLLEALRRLKGKKIRHDLYAVFTTQEEVGLRGALTGAYGVEPEIGIALDTTLAVDIPEVPPHLAVTEAGKGVGIKVMDASSISQRWLVQEFVALAEEKGIPHQMEVLPLGGTDAGAIQQARAGVPSLTLSIPSRYVHTVTEAVHLRDLEATVALLSAYLSGR
ncbi:M42 family metallopeptidase [Meiothermus granaticius]|uniref:Putative aminopeptidase YsdC n=1 Tax=Meiothermus granaticius NBRC 107808 TaxID=1227551 RepID=A0A399FCB5_9DEIN|nr:M42 family metallopeptidase [Meiothermus granaticius]RIH93376.1 putative aminopeptidase YsdC [Meiothermus granaticius NBRC 107808]GEM87625.1 peptidase M42 [Meiothermus granaticius NBRC 107808]